VAAALRIDADVIVIGFGEGANTLATALGRQGKHVVMIERSDRLYVGTRIHLGCVPTSSILFHPERAAAATEEAHSSALQAAAALTAEMRDEALAILGAIPSVEVLTGTPSFVDPHTVRVQLQSSIVMVTGRAIVIGTGSEPIWPSVPGLRGNPRAVSTAELFSAVRVSRRVVVLGGGYVGLEFAAMCAAFGGEVTVLERRPMILESEDDDVVRCVSEALGDAGVELITAAKVTLVDGSAVTYRVDGATSTVQADTILVASGWRPATTELNLRNAAIVTRADDTIVVDDHLRTNQSHVFAVGDVNGGGQSTCISLDDCRIVLDQLIGDGTRHTADRRAVPYVLFSAPPLARVGITERDARRSGYQVKVASLPVSELGTVARARIPRPPDGLMKVVVDADTDLILGAAFLGYDCHEVINIVALAIRHRITATELRGGIYSHPSMAEALNQLLGALS
jgi:pyruvate/2-oxoglutarate dehydrogenase complex dihydrolipoamide dehydrogenase (E3) component